MAAGPLGCERCGKPFIKMKAVSGVRIVMNSFTLGVMFLGIIEFAWEELLFTGVTFASINTMIAAFVVFVLMNVADDQTTREEKKHAVGSAVMCDECKVKHNAEVEQEGSNSRTSSRNESVSWTR
jgi:hypothetical protein